MASNPSLGAQTTRGVLWNFAQQLSQRGVGILITLLLARFLVPEDFGLMAMLAVFVAVASTVMDSGLKEALIREKSPTQTDFSTALFANIALGLLSYGLLFLTAPLVADFYQEPRLTALLRVVGVSIVINSLIVVQVAVLCRALNFKAQLRATVPATVISGLLAVLLAYAGAGVWALVAQMLIASALTAGLLWSMGLWRPSLRFSRRSLAGLLGFSSNIFATELLNTVFKNIVVMVIAKLFSASLAGYYFFAHKINELLISQLVNSIQTVTYPALATIQNEDVRLKAGYRKVIQVTTFLLFPILLLIAALADPLFHVFLPDRWLPAVVYLQLMCIEGLLYPLHAINLNILKVKGRTDLYLYLALLRKGIVIVVLAISVRFGILGILVGQIIASVISYLPNSYYSAQLIDYSVREQIGDVLPGLLLATLVAGLTLLVLGYSTLPPLAELTMLGAAAMLAYLGGAYGLRLSAVRFAGDLIRSKMKKGAL